MPEDGDTSRYYCLNANDARRGSVPRVYRVPSVPRVRIGNQRQRAAIPDIAQLPHSTGADRDNTGTVLAQGRVPGTNTHRLAGRAVAEGPVVHTVVERTAPEAPPEARHSG